MRAFSIVWKNARAKPPYMAGENLLNPAAMKIDRIMYSDAVAQVCATEQYCPAKGT